MKSGHKLHCILVGAVICLLSSSAVAELFDDFSSGTLDPNKWMEKIGSDVSNNLMTEHLVTNGVYHTSSSTFADRGVRLELQNRTFAVGDIVSYDVNYLAGSGNRRSFVTLDGYLNLQRPLFGYWNGLSEGGVGNDFGNYHIQLTFLDAGVYPEITLPNGQVKTLSSLIAYPSSSILQHTLAFGTRTGDNGYATMDYDNVYITQVPEPSAMILVVLGLGFVFYRKSCTRSASSL
jgi:hypothetical protein